MTIINMPYSEKGRDEHDRVFRRVAQEQKVPDKVLSGGMKYKPGETYHIYECGEQVKIHICATVDNNMVVYKYYWRRGCTWHYAIKNNVILDCAIKLFAGYTSKVLGEKKKV